MLSFHVMLYRIAMLLNIPTKHNYSYLLNCVMYKLVPNDTFKHLNTTHCIDIYFWFAIFKMREIGAGGSLQFVQADGARIVLKLEAFGAGVVWSLMTMGTIWVHYIPVVQKKLWIQFNFFWFYWWYSYKMSYLGFVYAKDKNDFWDRVSWMWMFLNTSFLT